MFLSWFFDDLSFFSNLATWHQYPMIFHDRIQKLCRNQFVRPAYLDITTKCQYLHHNHPYLRLGPFKYELLHSTPEIAYLHDFVTLEETEAIKSHASGKLKSTPYTSDSKFTSYSRRRTSKVMYINDNLNQNARKISNKIGNPLLRSTLNRSKMTSFQNN